MFEKTPTVIPDGALQNLPKLRAPTPIARAHTHPHADATLARARRCDRDAVLMCCTLPQRTHHATDRPAGKPKWMTASQSA